MVPHVVSKVCAENLRIRKKKQKVVDLVCQWCGGNKKETLRRLQFLHNRFTDFNRPKKKKMDLSMLQSATRLVTYRGNVPYHNFVSFPIISPELNFLQEA